MRPMSPTTAARYKRGSGLPISDQERKLLEVYDERCRRGKIRVHAGDAEKAKWSKLAAAGGQSLSSWVCAMIDRAIEPDSRLAELVAENQKRRDENENFRRALGDLTSENAQLRSKQAETERELMDTMAKLLRHQEARL